MILSDAADIRVGSEQAIAVYAGTVLDWPIPVLGYADEVLADNPIGYWRLGDAGPWSYGMPCPSEVGSLHGTYTGTPVLGVAGLLDGDADTAMQIAGGSVQGASLGGGAPFQIGTLSLEAWVKTPGSGSSYRSVAVKQNAYGIFVVDGAIGTYVWGTGQVVSTGVSIQDNVPHHIVMVLQESVALGSRFYCDGVAIGTAFTYTTGSHSTDLDVGYNAFGGQEFIGVIDEVALYDHVLTPERIAAHYNAGIGG